jgi:hypothetical protein
MFDKLEILANKNGVRRTRQKGASEKRQLVKKKSIKTTSTSKKSKLKTTRTKRTVRIPRIELGKPSYPYGLVYNYFKPHESYVDKLDYDKEVPIERHIYTGLGYLPFLNDDQLVAFLKHHRVIVLRKVEIYLNQRLKKIFNPNDTLSFGGLTIVNNNDKIDNTFWLI